MKKFSHIIKKYYIYLFFFCFYFLCLQFFYIFFAQDTFYNYGFSYAITKGEIPYNDFNLIVPLFSPFLYSIFLFFNHSILTYFLEQSLLLTIFSSILFKTLGKIKAWLLIIFILIPFPLPNVQLIFPGYNFITIFLLILIIYCEKEQKSDKVIGFLLGLSILTKQSIGICLLLPTLFYIKQPKKIRIRYLYCLLPIAIFCAYLLLSNSLSNFINLTVLGMIDFKNNNFNTQPVYIAIIVILAIITIIKIIKCKNIVYAYLLMSLSIVFPIIDSYHFSLYLILFIYVYLLNSKLNLNFKYLNIKCICLVTIMGLSTFYLTILSNKNLHLYNYHNFPFTLFSESYNKNLMELNKFIKNKETIFLIYNGKTCIILPAMNEKKITYYTILNKGNHGYKGSKKLLERLKNEKNKYIVIDTNIVKDKYAQSMFELSDYIQKHYKKIKNIGVFDIYYKN